MSFPVAGRTGLLLAECRNRRFQRLWHARDGENMILLLWAIRLFLGALLVTSGLSKLRQPYEFLSDVYAYQLAGPMLGLLVAALLPWLELVLGCCLLGGILTEGSLVATIGLTGIFAFATLSAWRRSLPIHCGCFGAGSDVVGSQSVVRAGGLLLLSSLGLALAIAQTRKNRPIHDQSTRPSSISEIPCPRHAALRQIL
jgi:uncharacterized membrane protein YphA (DoxX/SURF4 family)